MQNNELDHYLSQYTDINSKLSKPQCKTQKLLVEKVESNKEGKVIFNKEYDKYMRSHLTQAEKDYLEIMGEDIKKLN